MTKKWPSLRGRCLCPQVGGPPSLPSFDPLLEAAPAGDDDNDDNNDIDDDVDVDDDDDDDDDDNQGLPSGSGLQQWEHRAARAQRQSQCKNFIKW